MDFSLGKIQLRKEGDQMSQEQYIYAVARIRSKELTLLDKAVFDQLLSCKSYEECLRILADKGWGNSTNETAEEILLSEREKTWDLMKELVDDMSVFHTFLYEKDFHNLKAAIKQVYRNKEFTDIYSNNGIVEPEIIYEAIKQHDFSQLPEYLQESAKKAYQVQMHTGDGQLCDIILDKAALDTIYQNAQKSGNNLLAEYAELRVVAADINIAIRGAKTGKTIEFYEMALAECDSLNMKDLVVAALEGVDSIYEYLEKTKYSDVVPIIQESPTAFELWCDNLIIKHIQPQKYNPVSVSPLAAYILARENEIKSVRILLSGKLNQLPEGAIRERLRDMYV